MPIDVALAAAAVAHLGDLGDLLQEPGAVLFGTHGKHDVSRARHGAGDALAVTCVRLEFAVRRLPYCVDEFVPVARWNGPLPPRVAACMPRRRDAVRAIAALGLALGAAPQRVWAAPPSAPCQAGLGWLGDVTTLPVGPGDRLGAIAELSRDAASPFGWSERARLRTDLHTFVVLEQPGDSAALVVLDPRPDGFCVLSGWGYSFGGLGVELSIADLAVVLGRNGPREIVVLDAVATYNNPSDDPSDPTEPRRLAVAFGADGASVVADTRDARLAPLATWHWFLEERWGAVRLRMTQDHQALGFRIDPATWHLGPGSAPSASSVGGVARGLRRAGSRRRLPHPLPSHPLRSSRPSSPGGALVAAVARSGRCEGPAAEDGEAARDCARHDGHEQDHLHGGAAARCRPCAA